MVGKMQVLPHWHDGWCIPKTPHPKEAPKTPHPKEAIGQGWVLGLKIALICTYAINKLLASC